MKKKFSRILGVGLTFILLASLMAFAAPASAATLAWSAESIPSKTNQVLVPGSGVMDLAVAADGETIYAAVRLLQSETITATVTVAFTDGAVAGEIFNVTYTNQDGTAGRAGTVTLAAVNMGAAGVGTTVALLLAAGDTGVNAITAIAEPATNDATTGTFSLTGDTSATVFGTFTFAAVIAPALPWAVPAGTNTGAIFKSTDKGVTWSKLSLPAAITGVVNLVAVAPDDADIVVFLGNTLALTTNLIVYASTNGGTTFSTLGTIQSGTLALATALYDLDISPQSAGVNYVTAAGHAGAAAVPVVGDNAPGVYYFNLGASAPAWKNACVVSALTDWTAGVAATIDSIRAVKFSPNFASDQVMTAVSEDIGTAGGARFHIASFNNKTWDTAPFVGYPVSLEAGTCTALNKAAIALAPDYLGGDDTLRIAFVGASIQDVVVTADIGGIYRLKDITPKDMKAAAVGSIDYDGTNLVAGGWTNAQTGVLSNAVYRCAEPLVTDPVVSSTAALKRPGGSSLTVTNVLVAWAGADVVAGTSGDESGFSVSKNNGKTFNDISLIDTMLINVTDVALSADASKVYLVTDDGLDLSLWRKASSWERVLAVDTITNCIVRIAPENTDVVYVTDLGTTTIWYSSTGGDEKWLPRTCRYSVQDMSVESADVVYVGVSGAATVSKSTNAGFTWGSAKATSLVGGNIHSIASLGEDKVIVGSTTGYVSYSTDGNSSWTKISKQIGTGALLTQVTASGLADGDNIYAASTLATTTVVRWTIGTSVVWKSLVAPTTATYMAYGIALQDGVLYVTTTDGANSAILRTLSPTSASPTAGIWSTLTSAGEAFNAAPSGLRVTTGSTKLWAVDTVSTDGLYSYIDTLAAAGPTPLSPAEGATITVNPVTGLAFDLTFTWERLSKGDNYQLQIALDSGFTERYPTIALPADTTASIPARIVGPSGATVVNFMPGTTYYWHVRVASTEADATVFSPYSETRSFTVAEVEAPAPVVIPPAPAPEVTVTVPAPEVTVTVPPAAPAEPMIPSYLLWTIIGIGAVLVIAVIVLIVRTRRVA